MRLFLSCNVPEEIAKYIKQLSEKLPAAKLTVPHNIDLTIKFLGSVEDTKLEEIKKKLSEIEFSPFEATLDRLGVFPNENFIRVVWAGLQPEEKFNELHEKTDAALKGILPEEKRFKAHLTIARVKMIENKEQFIEDLKQIKIKPKKFAVDKLILFKSSLSPKGAVHEPVMEIKGKAL